MSHNYPHRRQLSDSDLRPDPGAHRSSDCHRASPNHNFYRVPRESSSSSYPSSSRPQWPQDSALNILNSCGLEPGDLALLAELPEDVLTVESLPQVLKQLKGKRGTVKPHPPSASPSSSSAYPHISARQPAGSPSTSSWDQPHSQLLQYPKGQVKVSPLLPDLDCWGNPRTCGSSRTSSSSNYVVDYYHGPGSSGHGKTGRDASPGSSQHRTSFSSAVEGKRTGPSRLSQPGSADYRSPPPEEYRPKTRGGHRESDSSFISGQLTAAMPSKKETLDFHGTTPPVYPYSCSLCDITVMSERVWIKHINGTHHADGQLSLLQRFPNWDCRMEPDSRADSQSDKWKDEAPPQQPPQAANQSSALQANKKPQKKAASKSKVVCAKFPAQAVDEAYLRKLVEPFGKIVKILMFPSLAFVELGSVDQAKDLVKFHENQPLTVNGEQMEFKMSHTFSFLQSSQVVSFSPAPSGENGQSDLISIVKRFGAPLYTLFLPSMAFVEMKNSSDAQKLVDYYTSKTLRINDDVIRVSFSREYKSLMRVASAKRYEEETGSTKRTRSLSHEKEEEENKKRRSSKDQEGEEQRDTRTRSKSREKSTKEKTAESMSQKKSSKEERSSSRDKSRTDESTRTRSESKEETSSSGEKRSRTRSKSKEKSTKDKTTWSRSRETTSQEKTTRNRSRENSSEERRTRSREKRSRSRDKFGRDKSTRSRSESREASIGERRSKSRSREKSVVPEKTEVTDTESGTNSEPAPVTESRPEEQSEEDTQSSTESDIEGMEVIGEDGENLEDEDMETLDGAEEEEEEEDKTEEASERTDSPEEGKETEVNEGEAEEQEEESEDPQLEDDEEEPDFQVDLENCITLDELEEDQSEDEDEVIGDELKETFSEICSKPAASNNCVLVLQTSRLEEGLDEKRSERKTQNRSESDCKSERTKESLKKTPEKELKKTPTMESVFKPDKKKSSEQKSVSRSCPEKKSSGKMSSEKEPITKNVSEKSSWTTPETVNKKTSEHESKESQKTPEVESVTETQNYSVSRTTQKELCDSSETSSRRRAEKECVEDASGREMRGLAEDASGREMRGLAEDATGQETRDLAEDASGREMRGLAEDASGRETRDLAEDATGRETRDLAEDASGRETRDLAKDMSVLEEESSRKTIPEDETLQRRDLGPEKNRKDSTSDNTETKQALEVDKEETYGSRLKDSQGSDQPKPQNEQKPVADWLEVQVEQQSEPAGGAVELQKPTKPVGVEFVRPVVGYFCNLCQLIYADEDEAKGQHCSSLAHYRKYQEKTGNDPWAG